MPLRRVLGTAPGSRPDAAAVRKGFGATRVVGVSIGVVSMVVGGVDQVHGGVLRGRLLRMTEVIGGVCHAAGDDD